MIRRTREQRDAEARNARQQVPQEGPRKSAPRGRKLGDVVDHRTPDALAISMSMPAMHGHLLPPGYVVPGGRLNEGNEG